MLVREDLAELGEARVQLVMHVALPQWEAVERGEVHLLRARSTVRATARVKARVRAKVRVRGTAKAAVRASRVRVRVRTRATCCHTRSHAS